MQLAPDTGLKKFNGNLVQLMQKYQGDRVQRWEQARKEATYPIADDVTMLTLDFTALPDIHLKKETEWANVSDPVYSLILGGVGAS